MVVFIVFLRYTYKYFISAYFYKSNIRIIVCNYCFIVYFFSKTINYYKKSNEVLTDNWDKRISLSVNAEKNYVAIDFALEYELYGSIYVWSVNEGGQAVLLAKIAPEGGIVEGAGKVVIKDSDGKVVTNEMLACYKKYTMYVSYDGASEICIGCDDYDEEFGGNILYFANAVNGKED